MAESFDKLVEAAKLTAVDTAALLGTRNDKGKQKCNKGPVKSTVKAKFYHLPDVAEIPTFNPKKELDPRVREHMSHGYGKLMLFYYLDFSYICRPLVNICLWLFWNRMGKAWFVLNFK